MSPGPRGVTVDAVVEQKHREMAAFVVVPAARVKAWKLGTTTTIEVTVDGVDIGRRSLLRWDEDRWFIELRRQHLEKIGKGRGDTVRVVMRLARGWEGYRPRAWRCSGAPSCAWMRSRRTCCRRPCARASSRAVSS